MNETPKLTSAQAASIEEGKKKITRTKERESDRAPKSPLTTKSQKNERRN